MGKLFARPFLELLTVRTPFGSSPGESRFYPLWRTLPAKKVHRENEAFSSTNEPADQRFPVAGESTGCLGGTCAETS